MAVLSVRAFYAVRGRAAQTVSRGRDACRGTIPRVSPKDRLSFFIGVGAIFVTLGAGTCSTNARFDDINRRIDDVNARFEARFDGVQADIRELRALVIDAIKNDDPAD